MLDILHRVDMPVDVHVVIAGVDGTHQFSAVAHLHAPTLVDGALLVLHDPVVDRPVVNSENIRRLSALRVDHRPDRASIAIHLALAIDYAEVSRCEVAHRTLHPRLHIELRVHPRHLLHLNRQSREHPRPLDGHQIPHTETAVCRVEVRRIEHMVPQMPHKEPLREITVKRLCHKLVCSYLFHCLYSNLLSYPPRHWYYR